MSFPFDIFLLFGALIPVLYPSFILNWIIISLFLSLFCEESYDFLAF